MIVVHAALFKVEYLTFHEKSYEGEAAPVLHGTIGLNELWWSRIACSNGYVCLWVTLRPPSSTAPIALEARPHCHLDLQMALQVDPWSARHRQSNGEGGLKVAVEDIIPPSSYSTLYLIPQRDDVKHTEV